jgi:alpha-L-fucosidase 2
VSGPGIWDSQPAAAWTDAFLAGSGRHGALVFGQPRDETVIVTQHRLVQPNGTAGQPPPWLAARLAEVRALLLAGESAAALDRLCAGWPEHPPQPFHPAFAVRSALPGLGPVTGYRRAVDFAAGLVSAEWSGPGRAAWRRTCFVSRARDVLVQHVAAERVDLVVRHDAALPGAPAGLGIEPRIRAAGGEAVLDVRVCYPAPESADYSGTTRIIANGGHCTADGDAVRVAGATEVLLLTQVNGPGLTGAAPDYRTLLAEHSRAHRAAYGQVRLDLGATPADRARPVGELLARQAASPGTPLPALLEKLFDSGRYLLLAASGLLPPRLTGLWQGDWAAAWANCLSVNANLNLQLAGAVTVDVPAAVHALASLVAAQLDDWRVNARRIFGCNGILAVAQGDGTDGLCRHFAAGWPHQIWTAGADWLLIPLLDYADATGDEEFLRTAVRPAAARPLRPPARQPPVPGLATARDQPGGHAGTGRRGGAGAAAARRGERFGARLAAPGTGRRPAAPGRPGRRPAGRADRAGLLLPLADEQPLPGAAGVQRRCRLCAAGPAH